MRGQQFLQMRYYQLLPISSAYPFTVSGYAAAKAGVDVLTRYMAIELGSRRISVNAIAPGATETDFGRGALRDDSALNAEFASMTALGRNAHPDDIGSVIAALLGEGTAWITGQRIETSGARFSEPTVAVEMAGPATLHFCIASTYMFVSGWAEGGLQRW